jgi:hypothetical protein
MIKSEIKHKIERVLNSCQNIDQLRFGNRYCGMLIGKYLPFSFSGDECISINEDSLNMRGFMDHIYKRVISRIEDET